MINLNHCRLSMASLLLVLTWGVCIVNIADGQQDPVDFKKQIKPLFEKYCLSCHGPDEEQVFRIDDKEDTIYYIEGGDADESQLYEVLITDDPDLLMPPPDEDNPMAKEEIELIKVWINQGANWPEGAEEVEEEKQVPVKEQPPVEQQQEESDQGTMDAAVGTATDPPATGQLQPEPPADAPAKKTDPRIFRAIGSLHPAILHLPMGLLLGAGFFALLSLRGNFVMSDCAYYCLWIGMIGCILASLTGWYFSPMKRLGTVEVFADLWNTDHRVFWHRTGGLAITVLALFLALYASSSRNRNPDDGIVWKLGVILLAGLVGWVGHEGGKLTHGKNHYKDLNELAGEWFPAIFGQPAPPPGKVDPPATESEQAPTAGESETSEDPATIGTSSADDAET